MRHCLLVLLCAFFLAWAPVRAEGPQDLPPYLPGRILVKLRPGNSIQEISSGKAIPQIGVVSVPVPEGQELEASRRLQERPEVEFAEPNYLVRASNTPNDPLFSFYQWNLRAIGAEAAWDIAAGGGDVTVAVLDTGVDLTHPDLAPKVLPGLNLLEPGASPQDDNGHGTHVAGIAAAAGNNGVGLAGVSWGAKILPVKVLNSSGEGTVEDLARGIVWATDQGARVINISSGSLDSSQTLQAAVDYAHDVKGALIAAAVGNEGGFGGLNPPQYPAAFPKVLGVAATDSNDRRADFSERGTFVDVAAPGVVIVSSVPQGTGRVPNTGGDYDYKSGTSMAAPHVAGLAALLWSANPALSNAQVARLIESTAKDLGPPGKDEFFGYGRIDAPAATRAATTGILSALPGNLSFLSDLASREAVTQTLALTNRGGIALDWTAIISPTVPWLSLSPASGHLEVLGGPQQVNIVARPQVDASVGVLSATVLLSGQGQVQNSPASIPIALRIVERIAKLFFPLLLKGQAGGW